MTRQEMNDIILSSFQTEIQDAPDLEQRIEERFSVWVQDLIAEGAQALAPQTEEQGQGDETESTTAEGNGAEGGEVTDVQTDQF